MHEGYMFSLLVQKQLELWPEKNIRKWRWVCLNLSFTNIDQLDYIGTQRMRTNIYSVKISGEREGSQRTMPIIVDERSFIWMSQAPIRLSSTAEPT